MRSGDNRSNDNNNVQLQDTIGDYKDTILSCCVHKPPKVYTFGFIVGDIIPKSVKCIHSATKYKMLWTCDWIASLSD